MSLDYITASSMGAGMRVRPPPILPKLCFRFLQCRNFRACRNAQHRIDVHGDRPRPSDIWCGVDASNFIYPADCFPIIIDYEVDMLLGRWRSQSGRAQNKCHQP